MKHTKRLLCVVLAAVMLLGISAGFSVSAAAGRVPLQKIIEADGWCSIIYNCEGELRANLLPGKNYADFEAWILHLSDNLWETANLRNNPTLYDDRGTPLVEINEPELIDQAQAVYAAYFGTAYAKKCAGFILLYVKACEPSFSLPHTSVSAPAPSRLALLIAEESYNNPNGIYDGAAWAEFAEIRKALAAAPRPTTIDQLTAYYTLQCDFNDASAELIDNIGFIGMWEVYVLAGNAFTRLVYTPLLNLMLLLRKILPIF